MTEPTEDRAAINARLARAMGWDFIQSPSEIALPGTGCWYTPLGREYGDEPPDFFTDAAASRMLVKWLKAQPHKVSHLFIAELCHRLWPRMDIFISSMPMDAHCIFDLLTCPLDAIARAADAAITTQPPLHSPPE